MMSASGCRAATARALASASRTDATAGSSPTRTVSSISGATTPNDRPSRSRSILRYVDDDAKISVGASLFRCEVIVLTLFFDIEWPIRYYPTFTRCGREGIIFRVRLSLQAQRPQQRIVANSAPKQGDPDAIRCAVHCGQTSDTV